MSRRVAVRAAAQTGLGPDILKGMLPMVASLVMGAMARGAAGSGGLQAGQSQLGTTAGGGLLDMLTPVLDGNRDGSVMDDLFGMAQEFVK